MTIVYDPLTYRTLVARPGEIPYKFWSVNKHVIDAAAAGICTLHPGDEAPGDTTKLWLDLTVPENAVGSVKAHNGSEWTALTPQLFYSHIAGGDARYPRLSQMLEWLGDTLTGLVPWRYVPPSTDAAAPKFTFSVQDAAWSNGPPSETNYWDHVTHLGWNWKGGTRESTAMAGHGLSFESKFWDGGRFGGEFHLQGEDTSGNPHRWFGMYLPHDGSPAIATFDVGGFNLRDNDSTPRVTCAFTDSPGSIHLNSGTQIRASTNNVPVLLQLNATGTAFMALPYIDNFNRAAMGAPLTIDAPAPDGEYGAGLSISLNGMTANKSCLYMQHTPAVTGTVYAVNAYNMATSGKAFLALGNNTVGGHAIGELRTEVGNGDPLQSFSVNGGAAWSVGIDNSDGDKFKIAAGWQRLGVGAEDRLVIDGDIVAEWKLPMKLRSYTVAGLPSASATGAGAMVYVSNASGGPTLACSDGTDWRVVAALGAVVS